MLQSLVIALREGLEAFLIVGITLAYLRQTGRAALVSAAHWGIGVSVLTCFTAGWALGQAESQPLWEGSLALVAAVLVISMVIYMLKAARFLKQRIHARLEASAAKTGTAAWLGAVRPANLAQAAFMQAQELPQRARQRVTLQQHIFRVEPAKGHVHVVRHDATAIIKKGCN